MGIPEIGMGFRFIAAIEIKSSRHFVTDGFVLNKSVFTCRQDRVLVQTHRLRVPAFNRGYLS